MVDDNVADTKIYLELDDELKNVLEDNELDISDLLQNEGIEAVVKPGTAPYQTEDNDARDKEPISIIIACSIAIVPIVWAISKGLSTLYNNKPIVEKISELVELRDANDNILMNKDGNPIFKKIERYVILQPKLEEKLEIKATFDLRNGIVIQISSETKS